MPRDCSSFRDLLEARWDGASLAEAEQQALETHLAACAECARDAADMEALLGAAAQMNDLSYERAITVAPLVLHPRLHRAPWLAWSAAVASLVAALWVGVRIGREQPQPAVLAGAAKGQMVVRVVVPAGGAHSVAVIGDFTGWNDSIPLSAVGDGLWVGELHLEPGRYRYVILVDGERMQTDPAARQEVDDGFGGKSSVLDVGSI